jgi:lysyl-tRNA synthetase class 2
LNYPNKKYKEENPYKELRDLGIDSYPAALYPVSSYAQEVKSTFEDGKEVCLAGRMMS